METYFDLSEKDRATLTEQQVQTYCDIALMQAHIRKPIPPMTMPESIRDLNVKTIQKWSAGAEELLFDTREQAIAFLVLKPCTKSYDYSGAGYDFKFPKPLDALPSPVTVYDHEDVLAKVAELKKYREKKEEIEAAQTDFEKQSAAVNNATKGIWGDWYEMQRREREYRQVIDAFAEYKRLAGGDETIAETFLRKTYGDKVGAAMEWFSVQEGVLA